MMLILQTFGAGLCFAIGAAVGVGIAVQIIAKMNSKQNHYLKAQNERIEKRLSQQVDALQEIAAAAKERK